MRYAALAILLVPIFSAGCVTTGIAADSGVIRAKDRVVPALVHIRPVKEVFAQGQRREVPVVGSGFIITPDGYVVTNEHVAGDSKYVQCVLSNKEEVAARVVGTDPFTDIAVLKLDDLDGNLPTVKLGSSKDLRAGQTVLALGSPHGLAKSVSKGIISVTDRFLGDQGELVSPYNTWIQTDAAINHGNSGGPLVNLRGEVIGVNARKLDNADNVGFAIPIDIAKDVVDQIIKEGRVRRAWLGLILQPTTSKTDDPNQQGVLIADIDPLSTAVDSGIRPGDILLSVGGAPTNARFPEDLPAVRQQIASLPVGEPVSLKVQRGGETREVELTPEELSALKGTQVELEAWGFTVTELTSAIARRAGLGSTEGVLVTGVQTGGVAGIAGLQRGDLILTLDEQPIADLQSFLELYQEVVDNQQELVLLDVRRGALVRYVLVKQQPEEVLDAGSPMEAQDNE